MEKYIVKVYEEECGYDYLEVFVPLGTPKKEVMKNFKMASNYACLLSYDEEHDDMSEYDEHLEDMLWFRELTNGEDTFCHYLQHYCGYSVYGLDVDFEFEW